MVEYTDGTDLKAGFQFYTKQGLQMFPNYYYNDYFALRMYLNLSMRVREVKELSKLDRQLKKVEGK